MNGHSYKVYKEDGEYFIMRRKAYKEFVDKSKVKSGFPMRKARKAVKGGPAVNRNLSKLMKEDKKLRQKIKKMEGLISSCSSADDTCYVELDKAKIDLRFSEEQNGQLLALIQKLTNENADLTALASQIDQLTEKCALDMRRSSTQVDGRIRELELALEARTAERDNSNAERDALQIQRDAMAGEKNDALALKNACDAEKEALHAQLVQVNAQMTALQAEKEQAVNDKQNKEAELLQIRGQLDKLREDLLNQQGTISQEQFDAKERELQELRETTEQRLRENEEQHETRLAEFNQAKNVLQNAMNKLQAEKTRVENESRNFQENYNRCEADLVTLRANLDQVQQQSEKDSQTCERDKSSLEEKLREKEANFLRKTDEYNLQIAQLSAEVATLQQQMTRLSALNSQLINKNEDLEFKLADKNESFEQLLAELNKLTQSNQQLRIQLERARANLQEREEAQQPVEQLSLGEAEEREEAQDFLQRQQEEEPQSQTQPLNLQPTVEEESAEIQQARQNLNDAVRSLHLLQERLKAKPRNQTLKAEVDRAKSVVERARNKLMKAMSGLEETETETDTESESSVRRSGRNRRSPDRYKPSFMFF